MKKLEVRKFFGKVLPALLLAVGLAFAGCDTGLGTSDSDNNNGDGNLEGKSDTYIMLPTRQN